MRITHLLRMAAVASLGATAITVSGLAAPAHARVADAGGVCLEQEAHDPADGARGGHAGLDHRSISSKEQRAIAARTNKILGGKQGRQAAASAAASVPVHVHVMRDAAGGGDVTDQQISQQISVLNSSFGGAGGAGAANTGFTFSLAGTYRYNNNQWHQDKQSATYRKQTRKGGANALNIWLVDFNYLGIATFPWDYKRNPGIDGIRVQYSSLPGG
ncbi:MAG: zinc metalloprotease, partial [Nocardioides sp.]